MHQKSLHSLLFAFCLALFFCGSSQASGQAPSKDILAYLRSLPGMEAEELDNAPSGYRYLLLRYEQPIDHAHPARGTFKQRMVLLHRSADAPMVLATNGYDIPVSSSRYAITRVLDASQLKVEHRYFAESAPSPLDWRYLTLEQAAADHHRIVQAIRPFYSGKWVSTGASKGGMTAMYHRRFYPNDVDGTLANVAPQSFARLDPRYAVFQEQVGSLACRNDLKRYQREVLTRRETMKAYIQRYAADKGLVYSLPGGLDRVLDLTVGELYFQFFQYGSLDNCAKIPANSASDQDLFDFLVAWGPLSSTDDSELARYEPYYYQAITQFGYPRLLTQHLRDLLKYDPNDYSAYVSQWPRQPFSPARMWDIAGFVALKARNVMMIYGDIDPWTAAAFLMPNSTLRGTRTFLVAGGNHGSDLPALNAQDKQKAYALLESWTGVKPSDPPLVLKREAADEPSEEFLLRRPL
ncbi:S28 family serine protease [Pseudomonas sp. RIT-PI-AD]|uniref:S28 family serine protease n=1 Tax=Pseudomonas sp. RIT-PI-AD TaxID=3035294 RepID=UPI0021D7D53F|nr:S28 family serine protease [Pseudomonas sp. RIT-PI-AD]